MLTEGKSLLTLSANARLYAYLVGEQVSNNQMVIVNGWY